MMNRVLASALLVTSLWIPASLFIILNETANQQFKYIVGLKGNESYKVDQRLASSTLLRFLENYYSYNQGDSISQKKEDLEKQLSPNIKRRILNDFDEILKSNDISKLEQKAEVLKIQYSDIDNSFIAYTRVNQTESRSETKKEIYLKSVIHLDPMIKISKIQEEKIPVSRAELQDKAIAMVKGSYSKVVLPCEIQSTSFGGQNKSIKRSLLSDNKGIEFTPEGVFTESIFNAGCKKRSFHLDLVDRSEFQTVYHKFEPTDGKLIARKLSKREKDLKSLEKQFGIKFE